tara:strand:- start:23 stop:223 length:201 start_codon:yes stop_codon:yes gene_type:complete
MAVYQLLNSDQSVAVAEIELADNEAVIAYCNDSEMNVFQYDEDEEGKTIFEQLGDSGQYQVIKLVG